MTKFSNGGLEGGRYEISFILHGFILRSSPYIPLFNSLTCKVNMYVNIRVLYI